MVVIIKDTLSSQVWSNCPRFRQRLLTRPSGTCSDIVFFTKMAVKCSRYYDYKDEVAELWKAGMDFINELNTGGHHDLPALLTALEAKVGIFASKCDPGKQGPQYVRPYWADWRQG
ncbi:hypothetical protein SELMODRAFT_427207 [Selaginella moellendorffii]|uniref:Uncharacterized protein n=1 Tax=Selaginella moellendorffii TaxID=88036 RepID=D8SYV3_SELML|nr:hypothetical protein SELMODRAFT_427207 [Selaginella moellendorffii]